MSTPVRLRHAALEGSPLRVHRSVTLPRGPKHERATHAHAVLLYVERGGARFEVGTELQLTAGDLVLVPHGMPHRTVEARDAEAWGVSLCASCWVRSDDRAVLRPLEQIRRGAMAVARVPVERRPWVLSLLGELERVQQQEGRALHLVALLLAEFEQHARWAGEGPDTVVQAALRYVEAHCLGPLSVADIARSVGRSPTHLTTLVKRETGSSLQGWITAGRLAEARRRLLHSDEAIDVIANRVGYADATHFIRLFRRETGQTPAAFRARAGRRRSLV